MICSVSRIKCRVKAAVVVKACDAFSGNVVVGSKTSGYHNPVIILKGSCHHCLSSGAAARVKTLVKAANAVQARNAVAGYIVEYGEGAAYHYLAIRLQRNTIDKMVGAGACVEFEIILAIRIQTQNPSGLNVIKRGKIATYQYFPVFL
jgi:hypothetical protein